VQYRVIDRRTQHFAERAGPERRVIVDVARFRAAIPDHLVRQLVELEKVHPHLGASDERAQHLGDEPAGRSHLLDFGRRPILDHPEILPYAVQPLDEVEPGWTEPTNAEAQRLPRLRTKSDVPSR
jgi:hypothetical protein